jgi:hypothetical protein
MHTQTHTLSLMHMTQVAVRYQSVRVCQGVAHVCVCVFDHIMCTGKDTLNHMNLNKRIHTQNISSA